MDAIVELEDVESIRRRRGYVDIPWIFFESSLLTVEVDVKV